MRQFLFNQRWWIAGSAFAGLSMFCAARHGAIEHEALHIWEEADRTYRETEPPATRETFTRKEPSKDDLS